VRRGLTGNLRDTVLRRPGEVTVRPRPIAAQLRRTTAPLRPIMLRLHRVGTREVVTSEADTPEGGIPEVVTQEAVVANRQAVVVVTREADTGDNAGSFAVTLNAACEGGVRL
jgi:hypothetical protein